MSLVIARQIEGEVYIIGDTKFTDCGYKGWSESKKYIGGLKVILLNPGLCVGFAGDVEFARNAIQNIYNTNINLFNKNETIEYFKMHNEKSIHNGTPTDFILAVILEDSVLPKNYIKEIFRIAEGQVFFENYTTQIGIGFQEFQRISHSTDRKSKIPTFEISKLGSKERLAFDRALTNAMFAMQSVMDGTCVQEVDGIRTVVISEENEFRYVEYVQLRGIPTPVQIGAKSPLHFGAAAEGSDHKHVGLFTSIGHGVFPVYSITGRFGIIYNPERSFEPSILPNLDLDEFKQAVHERISEVHTRALNYQNQF